MFLVPADVDQPMELKVIRNNWQNLGQLVGGYIEVIHPAQMPPLECGCLVTMVVNEEGMIHTLPRNPRATRALPKLSRMVLGDAVFVAEGLVSTRENGERVNEMDFLSLPPEFHDWQGPGTPYPSPSQPWRQ